MSFLYPTQATTKQKKKGSASLSFSFSIYLSLSLCDGNLRFMNSQNKSVQKLRNFIYLLFICCQQTNEIINLDLKARQQLL